MVQKLEDVMNEQQFNDAKELASKMLNTFENKQYTSAQIMLACAMLVGGFVYKDAKSLRLLHDAASFFANLFEISVKSYRREHNIPFEDETTQDESLWTSAPHSNTVN